jgi:energy-coupling factor transporter ATP-binding protein EcfA2
MIKRMYADNFKCLVNLTCKFKSITLLLGPNGTGKSAVFDVLRKVRAFATGKAPVALFDEATLTKWQRSDLQTFELEVEGNRGVYGYRLEVEHELGQDKQRVKLESVTYDGQPLYAARLGEVQFYRDDHSPGPTFGGDWSQSGLPFLGERRDNTKVTWFKKWLKEKLLCLQMEPSRMAEMWPTEETELNRGCENFVGWYRQLIQSEPGAMIDLFEALKGLYGESFTLELKQEGGTVRHLYAVLGVGQEAGEPSNIRLGFEQLSDGERALVVLYTLLHLIRDPDVTLGLDEPDNYAALAEIQPWLAALSARVEEARSQALLISHHPELINYLAPSCGIVFDRPNHGPTVAREFPAGSQEGGLPASELVARGWE